MSKMKIVDSMRFIACFICFSVLLVGGFPFPNWSLATQSVIEQPNSQVQSEELTTLPVNTKRSDQASVNQADQRTTAKEQRTETPSISVQPSQGKPPAQTLQSQTDGVQSQSPTVLLPSSDGTAQTQTVNSQSIQSVDPPGTPIHSYYDAAGNPPTAPGLAMRPRQFQSENGKMVYLTFDDGPYPSTTPEILAILAKENVHATFFVVGRRVELGPDLLKEEYEQGNAIGNHTYSHNMAQVYKGPEEFLADVKKAEDIIYQTIGIRPQIIRAPGGTVGHFNINYFNAVDAADYLMEDWNVDSGDTDDRLVPENQLIHNVEQQIQGKNRVVLLMHDLAGKTTTIQALPVIIEMLKKQGFTFGVLGPQVRPIVFPEGLHN